MNIYIIIWILTGIISALYIAYDMYKPITRITVKMILWPLFWGICLGGILGLVVVMERLFSLLFKLGNITIWEKK